MRNFPGKHEVDAMKAEIQELLRKKRYGRLSQWDGRRLDELEREIGGAELHDRITGYLKQGNAKDSEEPRS